MDALIDFEELAGEIAPIIDGLGRPLVLRQGTAPVEEGYDPVTGFPIEPDPGEVIEIPIRAVVSSITTGYAMRVGQQNVLSRDKLLVMGPYVEPHESDVVSFDGEDWQVVRVEKNAPNGTPLSYLVQVRP